MVLDSSAVIALLRAEEPAARRVHEVVEAARAGETRVYISTINLGEVYYVVGRSRGHDIAEEIMALIDELPIERLAANDVRVMAAARLKVTCRLSYADAFAAAAAAEMDGTLLTGAPELVLQSHALGIKVERLERVQGQPHAK